MPHRPLRLRSLEQQVPGAGMQRQWADSQLHHDAGRHHGYRDAGPAVSRLQSVDLRYVPTHELDRLKRVVTGCPLQLGDGLRNRELAYAPPLNEKKSLLLKLPSPSPNGALASWDHQQSHAHFDPRLAQGRTAHDGRRAEPRGAHAHKTSMISSGWELVEEDDLAASHDIVFYSGGHIHSPADGSGGLHGTACGTETGRTAAEAAARGQTAPSPVAPPLLGRGGGLGDQGSNGRRRFVQVPPGHSTRARLARPDLSAAARSAARRQISPKPKAMAADHLPRQGHEPSNPLHKFGVAFARDSVAAHNSVVKTVTEVVDQAAAVRAVVLQRRNEQRESFYDKVRQEGLEEFDNLDSSSTDEEFEEYLASGRRYSTKYFHPKAAHMEQKMARRRERQRQRLKRGLERRMELKAMVLAKQRAGGDDEAEVE
jgi:hypothetical protein